MQPVVTVHRRVLDPIRRGHPWIFKEAILKVRGAAAAGDAVALVDESGAALGFGVYDPSSPIAVRVWGASPLDGSLATARLEAAFRLRRELFADGTTTAYRLLNGEGDRTPGWVIDRYDNVGVLRTDGDAAAILATRFGATLEGALRAEGITTAVLRGAQKGEKRSSEVLFGPPPPDVIQVREHGVPFEVDLAGGQKTGAFLDQRENRARVGALVRGLVGRRGEISVLNLFSYAGGFSLHAALAGAKTTSVDVAPLAHKTAQASFRAAGLSLSGHAFVTSDVYAFLADAKKKGRTFDVVICDPPSFAPNERSVPRALQAYRSLHAAAAAVLADGGTLLAASCSSHVGMEAFLGTLDDAALGRADLRVTDVHGPPADHPSVATFPEGRYLKAVFMA
ncbi:MAG: class I SAM-dependent rRNA methyltransferase [Myxococcales bacterium]|nr:class I SAM-dependent rRNA methyltransferase [Myxococcales bacterium]MBL9112204.1 class I SAM-dependent rRNA methyltransferase [Myxococcales bacterium]